MAALRQWLGLLKNCRMPVVWLCKALRPCPQARLLAALA
jgi:hypothetical protein